MLSWSSAHQNHPPSSSRSCVSIRHSRAIVMDDIWDIACSSMVLEPSARSKSATVSALTKKIRALDASSFKIPWAKFIGPGVATSVKSKGTTSSHSKLAPFAQFSGT
eukprot:3941475-Rhodomonas_salina.7